MYASLGELRAECEKCEKCELCRTRTNLVFGTGNENAEVLFIGEAPGRDEDLSGVPFVGRSGQLLDKYLDAVGLDRNRNIYIANILKCRPPDNRDPNGNEQERCIPWLREQVRVIRPKIIVCVGRIAAQKIIGEKFLVSKQHGEFFERNGVLLMGTYHPAALLRNPNNKPLAFEDFLKLREKIKEVCPETYKGQEVL